MERTILFSKAWDKTDPDPHKNHGVSDLGIYFVIDGENDKFTSFQISTNWYLPHVMDRRLEAMKRDIWAGKEDFILMTWIAPKPLDVFYISIDKVYEDDTYFENGYPLFFGMGNKPCYYGYRYEKEESGLRTPDHVFSLLVREGDESVWEYLEEYYKEVFGNSL